MKQTGQWVVVSVYDAYGDTHVSDAYGPFASEAAADAYAKDLKDRDKDRDIIEYDYETYELWKGPVGSNE